VRIGCLVTAVALLTGCQATEPAQSSAPTRTITPAIFESRDAAVKAARNTYNAYLAAFAVVAESPSKGVDELSPYVTDAEIKRDRVSVESLAERRLRVVGHSELVKVRLQSARLDSGDVTAYVCVDVSGSRVINHAGKNVTPSTRHDRQTSIARFVWQGSKLLIDGTSPWSGEPIC
jgi:hypothetical protein